MTSYKINDFDIRIFFMIAFGGVLAIYTPIICSVVGEIMQLSGFWDKMKLLPYVFQMGILFSMFIGLGVIVKSFQDVVEYMMEFLFGKDEETETQKQIETVEEVEGETQ